MCDINTFKRNLRHSGSGALPAVGDTVYNANVSIFDGTLGENQGATYNWFIMTQNYSDGSTTVTNKYMLKIDDSGEVLDVIDCSVGSTTSTSTTTNPATPTTTVSFTPQNCPATFSYGQSGAQTFPSTTKVNLGTGIGWVDIDIATYNLPDKVIIKYLGDVVYDTGYLGSTTYQTDLNTELANRGLPSETITQGTGAQIRWFKPQSYALLDVEVYAPLSGTGWDVSVSCPAPPTTSSTTSTSSTTLEPTSSTTTKAPTTTTSTIDTDGDGIPDYLDPDDDNDGCYDQYDKYPLNAAFNADAFFKVYAVTDLNMDVGIPSFTKIVEQRSQRNVLMRQAYHHLVNLGNEFPEDNVIYNLGQTYFDTFQTYAINDYPNDLRGFYYYNRRPNPDLSNNLYSAPPCGSNIAIVPSEDDIDFNGGQNSFPQQNVSPYFAIINTNPGTVNDIIIVRWEDATVVAVYTKGFSGNLPSLLTLT